MGTKTNSKSSAGDCTLAQDIKRESQRLIAAIERILPEDQMRNIINGTGGKVSAADLLAYQIGWGQFLIRWYEAGIEGKMPEMPGEGFSTWDYVEIARHFYRTRKYGSIEEEILAFQQTVLTILEIVIKEHRNGRLDQAGVWPWCTLPSGKMWPLGKWIRVNTASPYKRATRIIRSTALSGE